MKSVSARKADFFMVLVTMFWGGTFPVIRDSLAYISPSAFVSLRLLLAALILLPFCLHRFKLLNKKIFVAAAIIGLFNGVAYFSQTIGLKTISSAESAFISALSVIIVPFLAPAFGLKKPKANELVAVVICVFGVFILTGMSVAAIKLADLLTFITALCTAFTILYIQRLNNSVQDVILFTFLQISISSLIPLMFSLSTHHFDIVLNATTLKALFYCSVLATILTFYLQFRFQRYTSPTRVGVIFTMEPVFGSLFAYFFNSEAMTKNILLGGGVLLVSFLISELKFGRWR